MRDAKADRLDEIIATHSRREGPLLPILHDIQAEFGCIDELAKRQIATALNLSRAEVHGVVSFYHDFKPKADHRPVVQICRAESCKSRGVEALMDEATRQNAALVEQAASAAASLQNEAENLASVVGVFKLDAGAAPVAMPPPRVAIQPANRLPSPPAKAPATRSVPRTPAGVTDEWETF